MPTMAIKPNFNTYLWKIRAINIMILQFFKNICEKAKFEIILGFYVGLKGSPEI
jgi:phosphorylcholine metabolism protein LicD